MPTEDALFGSATSARTNRLRESSAVAGETADDHITLRGQRHLNVDERSHDNLPQRQSSAQRQRLPLRKWEGQKSLESGVSLGSAASHSLTNRQNLRTRSLASQQPLLVGNVPDDADRKGPLKVPLPGPKPLDRTQGVRPNAGLWTALGGGIAVVLSEYSAQNAESDGTPKRSRLTELKHESCVTAVAWNPDSSQLATGDISGLAIVWDIVSGQLLRKMEVPVGGLSGICKLDWSPLGKKIACSASEGKVLVWSAADGSIIHALKGHNAYGVVRTCRFSPDGSMIASGGDFGIFMVWDAETGKPLRKLAGHSDHVNSSTWSPDSMRIASGSADNLLIIMDLQQDSKPLTVASHTSAGSGGLDGITCVRWSPKGTTIASAGRDMHIFLHDAKDGRVLHDLVGHTAAVLYCSWCKCGTRLASCAKDRVVIIWDTEGGAALHALVGHQLSAKRCSWDPAGHRLATAGADGKLLVWDGEAGTAVQELESMQERAQSSVATLPFEGLEVALYSPDGSVIVSAGGGGEVVIWDAQSDTLQRALDCKEDGILQCTWSSDSATVACGCENGTVILWNALSGAKIHTLKVHSEAVSGCEFSPDSCLVATSSADGKLIIWNAASGGRQSSCEGHEGPIACSEWSPDGAKLVSAGADGKVGIWDAATGTAIHMLTQHRGAVPCCSWSPNGMLIASCGWYDRSVLIWNSTTGRVMHHLRGHTGAVTVCRWSPNGRKVVSGGARGEVIVWDALSGSRMALLRGEHEAPEGCEFSPDSSMIFCYDGQTIQVWRSASQDSGTKRATFRPWSLLLQLQGHHDALSKCAWSPDSRFILSCGHDKRVVVWQVATGEPLYHLDGHQAGVRCAKWSPDGTAIISGDEASCLLIWTNLPRYSYMAAPGPTLFYFRIRLMHGTFERELANATAIAHPSVLTASTAEGTTMLHLAAQYTDLELLVWMLEFAAEHAFPLGMSNDRAGSSALDYAIQNQWWQGMSKLVGAIDAGNVRMSIDLQRCLFTSAAFKILLQHFARELEPLLKEGSACGISSVANGFTVSDTAGILLKLGQEGFGMIVAGSNHKLIPAVQMQAFWQQALQTRAAQKRTAFSSHPLTKQVDATAVVRLQRVGWAGCAAQAPNGILHSLLRSEVPAHMYGLPVVRAVIDLKWWSFARRYVMKELALYTLLLAMFTAYALALSETSASAETEAIGSQATGSARQQFGFAEIFIPSMAISVLALVGRSLTHELRQMRMYGKQHWSSFWNWMNAIAFSLYIPVVFMHACGLRNAGLFKIVLAADAVLLWANLLHYAKAFRGTGALVQMVTMTVSDMRWFVMLLFVVMCGFGTSFMVLFSGAREDRSADFSDVDNSLLTLFLFMLGSFNIEAFDLAAAPTAAILLFVFYEVMVTVVLLNLLIAIMGESFSKVVQNEEQQFLKGRAELIDEVEVALLPRQAANQNRANWFPRYLHILRPGQQSMREDTSEETWNKALAKSEKNLTDLVLKLQSMLQDQVSNQVSEAVAKELKRFLEQPLSDLGRSSWELDVG